MEEAILIVTVCLTVGAYFVHKFMSVLSELQDAVGQLQQVSALVQAELAKPRVLESDVAAVTPLILNVVDGLKRALPVPPPS
jgi:hypothetical protein